MRTFTFVLIAAIALLAVQASAIQTNSGAVDAPATPFSGTTPLGRRIVKKTTPAKKEVKKPKVVTIEPAYKPVKLTKKQLKAAAKKKAAKKLTAADFVAPTYPTAAPKPKAKPCAKKVAAKKKGPKFFEPKFKVEKKAKPAAKAPCKVKAKPAKATASPFVVPEMRAAKVSKKGKAAKAAKKSSGPKVEADAVVLPKLASTKEKLSVVGTKSASFSLVEEEAGVASDKISAELHELLMQTEDLIAESD